MGVYKEILKKKLLAYFEILHIGHFREIFKKFAVITENPSKINELINKIIFFDENIRK